MSAMHRLVAVTFALALLAMACGGGGPRELTVTEDILSIWVNGITQPDGDLPRQINSEEWNGIDTISIDLSGAHPDCSIAINLEDGEVLDSNEGDSPDVITADLAGRPAAVVGVSCYAAVIVGS